jgi:biopolymer transport protein TolQ
MKGLLMEAPLMDMLMKSGWIARIIILMMIFFSFICWAIIFNRLFVLGKITRGNNLFKAKFHTISQLSDIEKLDGKILESPLGQLGKNGAMEYKRILDDARSHTGVKDWSFFLQNQFAMASEHLESAFIGLAATFDKGVFFLAMMSSIAPFLGLLGTVWGIMHSFFEIGTQGSASLPVVAPGIAEALVTTIIGLAVAIPALFFYNYCNHKIERIENDMDEFRELIYVRLKREIFGLLYTDQQMSRSQPYQPKV